MLAERLDQVPIFHHSRLALPYERINLSPSRLPLRQQFKNAWSGRMRVTNPRTNARLSPPLSPRPPPLQLPPCPHSRLYRRHPHFPARLLFPLSVRSLPLRKTHYHPSFCLCLAFPASPFHLPPAPLRPAALLPPSPQAKSTIKNPVLATATRAIPKRAKRLGSYGNVMLKVRTPLASSRRLPSVIAVIQTPSERLTTPGPMLQLLNLDGSPATSALSRKSTHWKL